MAGVAPDVTAIPLGRPSPGASSNQPERQGQRMRPRLTPEGAKRIAPIRSCSRRGLPCRRRCRPRGALLPHPFTLTHAPDLAAGWMGGLLSVALSLGSPPPDVIRRRIRLEPGLSSASKRRPSGRLAKRAYGRSGAAVKEKRAVVSDWGCGARRGRRSLQLHPEYGIVPPEQATGLRALRPVAFLGGEQL